MAKKKKPEDKIIRPAHTLHFSVKKYPEVLEAANNLSKKLDRKPHDAMRWFSKAVNNNLDEILELCNKKKQAS